MPNIVLTGFEPFGGESINPSWEAVKLMPEEIAGYNVIKLRLPVEYGTAADILIGELGREKPALLIMCGQAGGRAAVTPEQTAVNLRRARIADNAGNMPADEPCVNGGPDGLFATLPVYDIVQRMAEEGFNVKLSYTAGTFVCNDLFYTAACRLQGSGVPLDFVHFPFLPEQAGEGQPSMGLEEMTGALRRFVELACSR